MEGTAHLRASPGERMEQTQPIPAFLGLSAGLGDGTRLAVRAQLGSARQAPVHGKQPQHWLHTDALASAGRVTSCTGHTDLCVVPLLVYVLLKLTQHVTSFGPQHSSGHRLHYRT